MQTQKIGADSPLSEDEDRGPVVGVLELQAGISFPLFRGSNQVGRGDQNDVILTHITISDVHADIEVQENDEVMVKDLRSSNGTFVEVSGEGDDFQQLGKGQRREIRDGFGVRFGLMRFTYKKSAVKEEGEDGSNEFDVESEEEEGGVEVNLNLKGVIDSTDEGGRLEGRDERKVSMFEEPTQCQDVLHVVADPTQEDLRRVSVFDQPTQRVDDDEFHTDTTFKQDGDVSIDEDNNDIYDAATLAQPTHINQSDDEEEEPTVILDQSIPDLSRRTSSTSVESPTQIIPEYPDQPVPDLSRRTSSGSVESPTQIIPDYSDQDETETETEGEEEDDTTHLKAKEEGVLVNSSSGVNLTPKDQQKKEDEDYNNVEESDNESEDIMMNSQAELNADVLQLILPTELQQDGLLSNEKDVDSVGRTKSRTPQQLKAEQTAVETDHTVLEDTVEENLANCTPLTDDNQKSSHKAISITEERKHNEKIDGNIQTNEEKGDDEVNEVPYLTQVSVSDRVDIRTVEMEVQDSYNSSTRLPRGARKPAQSLSEQFAAAHKDTGNGDNYGGETVTNTNTEKRGRKRGRIPADDHSTDGDKDNDDKEEKQMNAVEPKKKVGARGGESRLPQKKSNLDTTASDRSMHVAESDKNLRAKRSRTKNKEENENEKSDVDEKHPPTAGQKGKGEVSSSAAGGSVLSKRKRGAASKSDVGDVKADTDENDVIQSPKASSKRNTKSSPVALSNAKEAPSAAVRIIFTGVEADDRLKRMVKKIGGTIVDLSDMTGVTHVITDGSLKRTPKLLVALNLGACYVVGTEWLEDSVKQAHPSPLPISLEPPKLIKSKRGGKGKQDESYLVHDPEKEKKWAPFTLRKTLKINYERYRTHIQGEIFKDMGIFVASDVFGHGAPSRDEVAMIVDSGGGTLLTTASEITKYVKSKKGFATQPSDTRGVVILRKDEKKVPSKSIMSYAKSCYDRDEGAQGFYSVEFIFSAVMRQEIDFNIGLLSHLPL